MNIDPQICDYGALKEIYDTVADGVCQFAEWTAPAATMRDMRAYKGTLFTAGINQFHEDNFPCSPIKRTSTPITGVTFVQRHFSIAECWAEMQQRVTPVDKNEVILYAHGQAMGAIYDSIRIGAIFGGASVSTYPVIKKTVGPNTGLNVDKLLAAKAATKKIGASISCAPGNWTLLADAQLMPNLAGDLRYISRDFICGTPPLCRDYLGGSFAGINILEGPDGGINSIPNKDGVYLVPLVHKANLIQVNNGAPCRRVSPLSGRCGEEYITELLASAVIKNPKGVVLIECELDAKPNPKKE